MLKRLRYAILYSAYCIGVCAVMLLLAEMAIRLITDRPLRLFDATPLNHTSLYHPNSRIPMELMAVPYLIETNALGFRGSDISQEKPDGTTRIIALGDSITDGFLVDNPDTYPARLEKRLQIEGYRVEVVNAARGGSSIGREYWILRHYCERLSPDVVVLTFVANDIYELRNQTVDDLVNYSPEPYALIDGAALWAARSALGEWLLDLYFSQRLPGYRGQGITPSRTGDPGRYVVPGGTDYEAILPGALDSLQTLKLHQDTLEPVIQARVEVYLAVLKHLRDWCRARNIQLVWTWSPTFVQIYGAQAEEPVYNYLLPRVAEAGIPVIDGTPTFRAADRAIPLTLAPVDYHFTPEGYDRLAAAIQSGLVEHGILKPVNKEVE